MSHSPNRDYAAAAEALGISVAKAKEMDHTTGYATSNPGNPKWWSDTDTDLEITLAQWAQGWPIDAENAGTAWTDAWSNAKPSPGVVPGTVYQGALQSWVDQLPAGYADTPEGGRQAQFDKEAMLTKSGDPEPFGGRADARSYAGHLIGEDRTEKRRFDVVQDPTTKVWSYFFLTPFFEAPRNIKDAEKVAAVLNKQGVSTLVGGVFSILIKLYLALMTINICV